MNNKEEIIRQVRETGSENGKATVYHLPYGEIEPQSVSKSVSTKPKKKMWLFRVPGARMWKNMRRFLVVAVAGVLLVAGGIVVGNKWISTPDMNRQTVIEEVRELSYLTTAEAVVTTTLTGEDAYKFYDMELPGTKRVVHMDVPAKLLVGINLKQLTANDISIDQINKQITIILPHAGFLQEPNIDMDKVKLFSESGMFRRDLSPSEQQELLVQARGKLEQEAAESGVIQTAEDRAVRVLQQIYKPVGYHVNVAFQ
ncbi:uncharacterized protein DUF4230 [Aneurinibacillus soli]|uniref:Uncharacterized protein n=1 Tax=Aneurinibacillus soli TaxID=1500254 RepID=A0A0U5B4W9_9BACL|nr:DUF4230 domain-containing protein [Aneurinibacillus soli]PYE59284.1 uncharacterized protein DUF4230 [Aneurinibacillus soli]BAU26726.1 hypothetical protein CB4_00869 [Aneurinibacillus soli]